MWDFFDDLYLQKGAVIYLVEVKRKKGETFDALLRRFQGRFRDSGMSQEAKHRRFHDSGKNKNQRRDSALRREQKRETYEYLSKTGQLKEEPKRGPRR